MKIKMENGKEWLTVVCDDPFEIEEPKEIYTYEGKENGYHVFSNFFGEILIETYSDTSDLKIGNKYELRITDSDTPS